MNIEATLQKRAQDLICEFLNTGTNEKWVIIDESQCIKNHKAIRTRFALKLTKLSQRRFILSGTPMTMGPLDMFTQCKFLAPDSIPYNNFTSFKSIFAVEQVMKLGNRVFNKITGYKNLTHLTQILAPFCLRLKKSECLDLPDKIYTKHYVELSPEQAKMYKELKVQSTTITEGNDVVSVLQVIAKISKLHQICTGYVKSDSGDFIALDNNRLTALAQIKDSTDHLVVFCAFKQNVEAIKNYFKERNPEMEVVCYTGGEDEYERNRAINQFQSGSAKLFIGTSAAAKGITLTKASTVVYFSLDYALENYLQSQDRIHRIGQANACEYIHLIAPNSIEEKILQILANKQSLSDLVLKDLMKVLDE